MSETWSGLVNFKSSDLKRSVKARRARELKNWRALEISAVFMWEIRSPEFSR